MSRIVGGAGDQGDAIIDTHGAVLVDDIMAVAIDPGQGWPGPAFAVEFAGRVNATENRSETLYIMDADAVASLVVELVGLALRLDAVAADVGEHIKRAIDAAEEMRDAIRDLP